MVFGRAWTAVRPFALAAATFTLAAVINWALPPMDATSPLMRYVLEVGTLVAVVAGATATWWAVRTGSAWDADLWPALLGAAAAFSLLGLLHGTPYAPNGLQGDQSFRTEAITRFASTWQLVDFTYRGLPSFYAPAFFWVLGRVAELFSIEPWRTLKLGTILTAMVVPVLAYVLWRRHLPARVAVLVSAVTLLVQNSYEPYAWLVIVAIVPWWLEVAQGPSRPGVRPWHPILLGLFGAVLFLTYYYFFFVAALAFVLRILLHHSWAGARRNLAAAALGLSTFVAATAVFWLPLVISIAQAGAAATEANRYFPNDAGELQPIFLGTTPMGLISLLGLGYLVMSARRDPLSRGLIIFLAAYGVWFVLGLFATLAGHPLVTFRSRPFVPLILVTAGILGAVRVAERTAELLASGTRSGVAHIADGRALGGMFAVLFLFLAGHSFLDTVASDGLISNAWAERLPDGGVQLPTTAKVAPAYVSEQRLERAIMSNYHGRNPPVVLSTRNDVMDLTTAYGFVQTQFYYSHPAGQFTRRIAFLRAAAALPPLEFAQATADNPFDRIDAFVLKANGPNLVFEFSDDNFPRGSKRASVSIPRSLFDPANFAVVDLGEYVVAVRR